MSKWRYVFVLFLVLSAIHMSFRPTCWLFVLDVCRQSIVGETSARSSSQPRKGSSSTLKTIIDTDVGGTAISATRRARASTPSKPTRTSSTVLIPTVSIIVLCICNSSCIKAIRPTICTIVPFQKGGHANSAERKWRQNAT